MGSGKSSFGRNLAKKCSASFFDIDNEIKERCEFSPKEIYHYFGQNALHTIEHEILQKIAEKPAIISTGDGMILNDKAWNFIMKNTTTIWLDVNLKLVSTRLRPTENRPYLENNVNSSNVLNFLQKLRNERIDKYSQAEIILSNYSVTQKNITKIFDLIAEKQKINDCINEN